MLSFRPFEPEDRMSNRFVHKTIPFFINTRSRQCELGRGNLKYNEIYYNKLASE